ncbi:hypothetical protein [Sphingomonas sp.]|uniref:hypothetical protein n=1 Tax=Sphingomonas sp. TaxID=28214 RepID=UPI0035BC7516
MPHPLTRAKALQNAAFLRRLEATGNVRLAAEQAGVSYLTMQRRRIAHPDFAQKWDAALVVATARLARRQATPPPAQEDWRSPVAGRTVPRTVLDHAGPGRPATASKLGEDRKKDRTLGGEMVTVRRRDGTVQVRRAHPGRLTRAAEQRFLAALSATCNVRLAAAAVGTQSTHFYRRRQDSPAFAREWRMALAQGYEAVEMALLAAGLPESHAHDDWRHNAPPAVPPMTANQALQLLYLHQKAVLNQDAPPHIKRRRGESPGAHSHRLAAMHEARMERDREAFRVMEAARLARGENPYWHCPPDTPDLAQVAGWSRADPAKAPHDDTRALFGGWRIGDMKGKDGSSRS